VLTSSVLKDLADTYATTYGVDAKSLSISK